MPQDIADLKKKLKTACHPPIKSKLSDDHWMQWRMVRYQQHKNISYYYSAYTLYKSINILL